MTPPKIKYRALGFHITDKDGNEYVKYAAEYYDEDLLMFVPVGDSLFLKRSTALGVARCHRLKLVRERCKVKCQKIEREAFRSKAGGKERIGTPLQGDGSGG